MKFDVNIYKESGEFVSSITLDSEHDYVDRIPVTTISLAERYMEKYILKPEQYCIVHTLRSTKVIR